VKIQKTVVIALAGSIIVPKNGIIDSDFLANFKKIVLKFVSRGYRFVLIVGGGRTARIYQQAASEADKCSFYDQDLIGILATQLNAKLVQVVLGEKTYQRIVNDPNEVIKTKKPIIVASGWKPGWSTDYDAMLFAKKFKTGEIIDAGNISFVYNEDPKIAKKEGRKVFPIKNISWKNYQKMISQRWVPGLSAPIDPIASRLAQKNKLKAIIILGTDLKNFDNLLNGKSYKGTIIE